MCNHDVKDLIGGAGYIKCRACGKTFKDFKELEADREPLPFSEPEKPEEPPKEIAQDGQIEPKIEEPKKDTTKKKTAPKQAKKR